MKKWIIVLLIILLVVIGTMFILYRLNSVSNEENSDASAQYVKINNEYIPLSSKVIEKEMRVKGRIATIDNNKITTMDSYIFNNVFVRLDGYYNIDMEITSNTKIINYIDSSIISNSYISREDILFFEGKVQYTEDSKQYISIRSDISEIYVLKYSDFIEIQKNFLKDKLEINNLKMLHKEIDESGEGYIYCKSSITIKDGENLPFLLKFQVSSDTIIENNDLKYDTDKDISVVLDKPIENPKVNAEEIRKVVKVIY